MIDAPFRSWLGPRAHFLNTLYGRCALSPNHLTLGGFALAVLASAACAYGENAWAIGLWWTGRLLDGTDGIYARATGQATPFGAYLDITCDMAAYTAMAIGFAYAFPELGGIWMAIVGLYVLCITSALAFGAAQEQIALPPGDNRGLRLGAGLAEGGETGIAYTLFLLFPGSIEILALAWTGVLAFTVVARTLLARRVLAP